MSLLAVRRDFAKLSGRHDLVTNFGAGTYTDNGADFFLDSGQRMLDRKAGFLRAYAWYKKDVAVGSYKLIFQKSAVVKEVWVKCSGEDRYQLEKKDLEWLRTEYGDDYSALDQDAPLYYSPMPINLAPTQSALTGTTYTTEFTYDVEELSLPTDDYNAYSGILFMPPVDQTYTVSVLGRFESKTLTGDVKTWWTEVHPDILILAGMWSLERFYRNSEGQRDYMLAINDAINDLDRDLVEQEVQDIDEMEG
jgi:hypothetical protein